MSKEKIKLNESTIDNIIGSLFLYQRHVWEVKMEGKNGMFGVECRNHNRAYISLRIDKIIELINKI